MTENKRFIVKGFDEYDKRVWDTEFEQSCDVEQVVDMLNNKDWVIDNLREENEELKEGLKELKEIGDYQGDMIQELDTENQQLIKENENLKKELKRCKDWINSDKNDYELTLAFVKNKGYSLRDVLKYEKELQKND